MIYRTWTDNEDRYTVVTNNGRSVLISTGSYTTALAYEHYARRNISAETMAKFQRHLNRHKKYWRDGFEGLLEEAGLEHLYKQDIRKRID